ncbi:CRISPR-associated endonuclease Cas2 [Paenibacillus physcomitrellae]|uniref:CRISPR-associated endoribonuclease Cas2 n=1 Tax=Paenibacillus physcomitrellae TaxID=1619311 RepID=A0ABQ1G027_9BACL|nr:CRISPR-associated endonuclease Cas2 [Paenibacillus physcomitrellae]GGA34788.1 CRISPR-associated endoribonuclease Cas2 [Paenibacillus physcomitrellae]
MMVVITYDVRTVDSSGQRRLRQVAKVCQNYGQRVQNSVFECIVDAAEWAALKLRLIELIDPEQDSLRFYQLGNQYKNKVEHVGIKTSLDLEGPLIL